MWDKHASPMGIAALCVCLGGGSLYQQAPVRTKSTTGSEKEKGKPPESHVLMKSTR